ncbi:MAG: Gfo/Idh/MocA family oxidoreductase [Pirellulaceae bacterium]
MAVNRREFISSATRVSAALGAVLFAGHGFAAPTRSPNERLNLAAIGVGNKGKHNIDELKDQNWVAFCDVDENILNASAAEFAGVKKFRDYRRMFDEMANDIDAVVISTADHTHAPATSIALDLGKHAYCEKPLTHTVAESRAIAKLAAKQKVATQMGIQIHAGDNYRRVVELIQSGTIGNVTSVYSWCNKDWSGGRFCTEPQTPPANLDWDLWLGPAQERPYCAEIHPGNWRRYWEFGSGTFGDMACHVMDLPFWALDLQHPKRVRCEGPDRHPVGTPKWTRASYEFERNDQPLMFHWCDGGENFDVVRETMDAEGKPLSDWGLGVLFVGDKGMLAADYGRRQLLPAESFQEAIAPPQTIENSIGHWNEWIHACKTGAPTTCNFDYASRLTETVLLGIVAYRGEGDVVWDSENLTCVGNDRASELISKVYRKGFEVVGLKS